MILTVAGVKFRYNSHPVLEDISFSLPRGKVLALLGVNGAGKSTLLKCMNRILKPESGIIRIGDKDISSFTRNEIATHFGYVPQRHSEQPMTVFDLILLGRKPYIKWAPTEKDLRIVENIINVMGLGHLATRQASQLSGGEVQKIVLARALAQETKILLLDEPTSNLDIKNQLQVMALMKKAVTSQGLTAVVSVHDINLAFRFADFFLMLKDHRIHTLTPKEKITTHMIEAVYGISVAMGCVCGHTVVVPVEPREA